MRYIIFLMIGIGLIVFSGCSEGTMESVENDELAIMQVIQTVEDNEYEDYFYASLDDENQDALLKSFENALLKPIWPIRFGRIGSRPLVRDFDIEITSENQATVTYKVVLNGNYVILAAHTPDEQPVDIYPVLKPMIHEFRRIAHFEKIGDESMDLRRRWKLVDFSMALGKSMDLDDTQTANTSLEIISLKVAYNDTEIEITDPLAYFQTRENVFSFEHGTQVTLTVQVKNESPNKIQLPASEATELVRLHYARHRFRRLHGISRFGYIESLENGNKIYQGSWIVNDWVRVHHAAIDVIDAGTIFDDDGTAYPYNSITWSTPYKVIRPE